MLRSNTSAREEEQKSGKTESKEVKKKTWKERVGAAKQGLPVTMY